ncbi:hypothetical protein N7540_003682 [Penicillium herquei]|nr:hypothetical protein N7540_003682 [Penicillium herquei]
MMKSFIAIAAFAAGTNALVGRSDSCCFDLTASGGASGVLGQLTDGQVRVGDNNLSAAQFCINSAGGITDSEGRGCILTPETTQFQCDTGANATTGFSITSSGELEYNGSPRFIACETGQNGGRNVYTTNSTSVTQCVNIQLTADSCSSSSPGASSSPAASMTPAHSTAPIVPSSTPVAPSVAPSSSPAAIVPSGSAPAASPSSSCEASPIYITTTVTVTECGACPSGTPGAPVPVSTPGFETSAVGGGAPAPSGSPAPQGSSSPSGVVPEAPHSTSAVVVGGGSPAPSGSPAPETPAAQSSPAPSGSPAPESSASPKPSGPVPMSTSVATPAESSVPATTPVVAPSPSSSASQASSSASATKSSSGACATTLTDGDYQYPHLIIPISSSSPDTAYGTQYFGNVSTTVSTIFNFDIPSSYEGSTCNLVFLFPKKSQLETSDYTFSGNGKIDFSKLSEVASEETTYSNAPSVSDNLGDITISEGNSYVVSSFSCPAGETVAYEMSEAGTTDLWWFNDWNPSPLGIFITKC